MTGSLRSAASLLILAALVYGGFRLLVRPARSAAVLGAERQAAALSARLSGEGARADGDPDGDPGGGPDRGTDQRLGADLARLRERVRMLAGVVESGGQQRAVLDSLTAMAAEENVHFRRFAPEPETRLGRYVAQAATVVAEGRFFDFVRLFERLSALPQLVLVEEVEFRATPDGDLTSRFVAITIRRGEAATGRPAAGAGTTGGGS